MSLRRFASRAAALASLFLPSVARAQAPDSGGATMPNQTVYVEIGGNAGIVSFNYDRKLNDSFTVRVGAGRSTSLTAFAGDQLPQYARLYPLMLNYLLHDRGSPDWFELGLGAVVGYNWQDGNASTRSEVLSATGTFGYRRMSHHFVFRMGFMPHYAIRGVFPHDGWGYRLGLSFGVAF